MNGRSTAPLPFPKPGPVLATVLVAMSVAGISGAMLAAWAPAGLEVFPWLAFQPDRPLALPWRWITSALLTSPESWGHLFFSLVGLYFLGAPLERRWGGWRLARFLAAAVILGNLVTFLVARAMPPGAPARFAPPLVFGPTAAITATAVAWAREYSDSTVQLFFVLPVRGAVLLWVTIGFCVLDLVYPAGMPEGVVAPFGGVLAGLALGGSPSLLRSVWLRGRLALLRRQSRRVVTEDMLSPRPARKPKSSPPLRVVPGGMEEVLRKRNPSKDKRFLN